jgi:hypothetical protein
MRRDQFTCLIDGLVRFGVVLFGPSRDLMLAWPLLSDLDLTTIIISTIWHGRYWGPHVQLDLIYLRMWLRLAIRPPPRFQVYCALIFALVLIMSSIAYRCPAYWGGKMLRVVAEVLAVSHRVMCIQRRIILQIMIVISYSGTLTYQASLTCKLMGSEL